MPHIFIREGHKFALLWVESDTDDTFDLKVDDQALSSLKYLDSSFSLVREKPDVFKAYLDLNEWDRVASLQDTFEFLPGILAHKILDTIGEKPVT